LSACQRKAETPGTEERRGMFLERMKGTIDAHPKEDATQKRRQLIAESVKEPAKGYLHILVKISSNEGAK